MKRLREREREKKKKRKRKHCETKEIFEDCANVKTTNTVFVEVEVRDGCTVSTCNSVGH